LTASGFTPFSAWFGPQARWLLDEHIDVLLQIILYSTIMGTIGALIPFVSRRSKNTFFLLEMEMRKEGNLHFKRDHIAFRSYFSPVKEVIDGDLCERFGSLPSAKQKAVAREVLDRTPAEVQKLLEDFRNSIV
jgi:splicing factor 3B subunit 3